MDKCEKMIFLPLSHLHMRTHTQMLCYGLQNRIFFLLFFAIGPLILTFALEEESSPGSRSHDLFCLLLLLPTPRLPPLPRRRVAARLRLGTSSPQRGGTATKWRTLGHGPPPGEGVEVPGSSPYTGVALLFPQSQVLGFRAFPKKYSCYLLKQILSPPHLIIQWGTLELSTGWKITRFSKYKIPLSAAFASPSFCLPWPRQPPAIQTLTISAPWSQKERRTGRGLISSLWDVYCFFCSQWSKVSVVLCDIL